MVQAKSNAKITRIGTPDGLRGDVFRINKPAGAGGIPDINLLTAALDPRITYSGPAHHYLASNGVLTLSAANQWPLEFKDGVAVGRHEPEPAGSNLCVAPYFTPVSVGGAQDNWTLTGSGAGPVVATGGINGQPCLTTDADFTMGAVYDGSAFVVPDTTPFVLLPITNGWSRVRMGYSFAAAAAQGRFYPARADAARYAYYRTAMPAGAVTLTSFRQAYTDTTNKLRHSLTQIEAGALATSPMLSSRAASSVSVSRPVGAAGITVRFSDATSKVYTFGTASSITLDLASTHWGVRYITRIEFIEG